MKKLQTLTLLPYRRALLHLIVLVGTIVTVTACAWRGPHLIEDATFDALYPDGVSAVTSAQQAVVRAEQLQVAARNSQNGAAALRRAIRARFDELEEALDRSESWGVAGLHEGWGQASLEAANECRPLAGAIAYLAEVGDDSAAALQKYRKRLAAEAEALVQLRQDEYHASKIDPFFQSVPAGPELNPTGMHAEWEDAIATSRQKWVISQQERRHAARSFALAVSEFEGYRAVLPAETVCPIFLRHDPLLDGFSWEQGMVEWLPSLKAGGAAASITHETSD